MAGLILAAVSPDNTPHGYNWTFAYPMLLFIVIGGVLYYLFGRPHRRVPPRPISASAPAGGETAAGETAARETAAGDATAEHTGAPE